MIFVFKPTFGANLSKSGFNKIKMKKESRIITLMVVGFITNGDTRHHSDINSLTQDGT